MLGVESHHSIDGLEQAEDCGVEARNCTTKRCIASAVIAYASDG